MLIITATPQPAQEANVFMSCQRFLSWNSTHACVYLEEKLTNTHLAGALKDLSYICVHYHLLSVLSASNQWKQAPGNGDLQPAQWQPSGGSPLVKRALSSCSSLYFNVYTSLCDCDEVRLSFLSHCKQPWTDISVFVSILSSPKPVRADGLPVPVDGPLILSTVTSCVFRAEWSINPICCVALYELKLDWMMFDLMGEHLKMFTFSLQSFVEKQTNVCSAASGTPAALKHKLC